MTAIKQTVSRSYFSSQKARVELALSLPTSWAGLKELAREIIAYEGVPDDAEAMFFDGYAEVDFTRKATQEEIDRFASDDLQRHRREYAEAKKRLEALEAKLGQPAQA